MKFYNRGNMTRGFSNISNSQIYLANQKNKNIINNNSKYNNSQTIKNPSDFELFEKKVNLEFNGIKQQMREIKESYREKYQRALKELNNEKTLSLLNEQKIISLEKKLEELCENNLDNSITRTYKISKNNKDLDKFEKIEKVHHSPQMNHKSISRFSTNQTNSTKKIVTNNNDDNEINPDNYSIIKKIKLGNNLEWYLF